MLRCGRTIRTVACVGIATSLLTAGCGKSGAPSPAAVAAPAPAMKPAPPTPIDEKRAEIGGPMWDPAWDKIVELALPPDLLSAGVDRDVRPYCPRFDTMAEADKRAFWAYFFQALAGAEGGLKPTSEVRHAQSAMEVRDSVTGAQVRTEGLLQLAYEDAKRYGCDFDWDADRRLKSNDPARTILRPKNNLECGIDILHRELIEQRKPLLSRDEYWSTLRPGTASYRVFAKQMANVPAVCGRRAGQTRRSAAHGTPSQQELISASR
jgi:hypothetical protein